MRYRVIIAETSEIVSRGLADIIDGNKYDVRILSNIQSVADIECSLASFRPDVLIINPTLTGCMENISRIKSMQSGIYVVALVYQTVGPNVLHQYNGVINIWDNEAAVNSVLEELCNTDDAESETFELSNREKDVLVLVAKGLMSKEIADKLNISVHTVMTHRKNITKKTGIKSIAGLVVYAMLNNLMDVSELE